MANQSIHIVEYRAEPPPTPPPAQPSPVTAPLQYPDPSTTLTARNELSRSLGVGTTVDVLI